MRTETRSGEPWRISFFDNIEIDDNFNFVFNDPGFNFGDFGVTFNESESFSFNDNNFLDPFLFGNDSFYDTSIGVPSSFEDPSAITELGLERPLDGLVKFFNPEFDLADSFLEDPSAGLFATTGLFATIGTAFEGRFKKITTAFKAFGSVTRSLFKPFGTKVAKGTIPRNKSLSTIRQAGPDESFVRFESENVRFSKVTSQGGLKPGSFAAPTSELPVPLSQRATRFNLPDPQIPRTRQLNIRAPGDLIIGPRPVKGGTGNEVLFPFGTRPGTVR